MNAYRIGEEVFKVELKKDGGGHALFVNGGKVWDGLSFERVSGQEFLVRSGNDVFYAHVRRAHDDLFCHIGGECYKMAVCDLFAGASQTGAHAGGEEKVVTAPMPGKVVKIAVKAGDEVRRGSRMMIVESMKMETEIVAPADGKVRRVGCGEGEIFKEGEVLVEME